MGGAVTGWMGRGVVVRLERLTRRFGRLTPRDLHRDVLVTGCGASGTTWTARLLQANGVSVSHDWHLGRQGIVTNGCDSNFVTVFDHSDSDLPSHAMMRVPVRYFRARIHVVRDPRRVVGSITRKWQKYGDIWPHVKEGLPELAEADPSATATALRYWLRWNEMVESVAHSRFRVEQLTEDPQPLFEAIGRRWWGITPPPGTNSVGTVRYPTWTELERLEPSLTEHARALAVRYGYED